MRTAADGDASRLVGPDRGARRILFATARLLSTSTLDRPLAQNKTPCPSGSRNGILNRRKETLMIIIYLIAAAVLICGCLFVVRARSRD
jgi:hypothetical protein